MTEKKLKNMANAITKSEDNLQKRQEKIATAADYFTRLEKQQYVDLEKMTCVKEYDKVSVVRNQEYQWGVVKVNGEVVVPFGKYGWIDGFEYGFARVRTQGHSGRVGNTIAIIDIEDQTPTPIIEGKENIQNYYNEDKLIHPEKYSKWGIINEEGEEVLPVVYDNVWNFLDKNLDYTTVERDGKKQKVYFHDLNRTHPIS